MPSTNLQQNSLASTSVFLFPFNITCSNHVYSPALLSYAVMGRSSILLFILIAELMGPSEPFGKGKGVSRRMFVVSRSAIRERKQILITRISGCDGRNRYLFCSPSSSDRPLSRSDPLSPAARTSNGPTNRLNDTCSVYAYALLLSQSQLLMTPIG